MRNAQPLWAWPHLLSLDAPFVAMSWQLLLSRTLVPIPRADIFSLGAIIWCIYLTDHLLDTLKPPTSSEPLRHQFTRAFRLPLSLLVGCVLIAVFATLSPVFVLQSLPVFGLLLCHFLAVHFLPANYARLWPKELAVAAIFTLGVSTPVFFANSVSLATAISFSVAFLLLCFWNCASIDFWEHSSPRTHWLSTFQIPVAILAALACFAIANFTSIRLMSALAFAFLLSSLLAWTAPKLSPLALRVAADTLLLTPWIVL